MAGPGDFIGDEQAVTFSMPRCDPTHPPFREWPARNLIAGQCPKCWHFMGNNEHVSNLMVRELRARRVIQKRGL